MKDTCCAHDKARDKSPKQAIHLLIQTNHMHRRIIEKRTQNTELHLSQHRMLMHISRFDNIPSQKELAKHFGISDAAVAASLKKLEADGYIERTRVDTDTRHVSIKITSKGMQEIVSSREYFDFVDNTMFNGFTNQEISTLIELIQKANQNLKGLDTRDQTQQ